MTALTLFEAIFTEDRTARTAIIAAQNGEVREISYAELRSQISRAAQVLSALELQQGERVAILLNDSPEFIATSVAIQSLGATAVPINRGLGVAEQRLILADKGARIAIIEADSCNILPTEASDQPQHLKDILIVRRHGEWVSEVPAAYSAQPFEVAPGKAISGQFPVPVT